METKFAPAERSSHENLIRSYLSLEKMGYLNEVFCSLSYIFCILNENRQIVFSNDILMKTLEVSNVNQVLGKRFGEAINCRFAFENEAGCGTSEHCRYCGAVNAMLNCQKNNQKTTAECRVRRYVDKSESYLDVEVTATPFTYDGSTYTIFSLIDISDRKRRAIIEKIFFHDIMNVASGLQGFFELFNSVSPKEQQELLEMGASLTQQIVDEITTQRVLTQAENNELAVNVQPIESLTLIRQIANDLQLLEVANEKIIEVNSRSESIEFESDPVLLRRVLNIMVKNALEASSPGQKVTITALRKEGKISFEVHNVKPVPRDVEMQIFMRSFSTKGAQRGIGTYSMKILGEQFLKGEVGFKTSEKDGTTFYINL